METSEHIVYKSTVEARSLRRRASRLLPVSVQAVKKPKLRQLVLTDKRLVLLKTKKIGGPATVKAQYAVRPANASRSSERKDEKDGKEGKDSKDSKELTRITSSDLKGDRMLFWGCGQLRVFPSITLYCYIGERRGAWLLLLLEETHLLFRDGVVSQH